MLEIEESGEGKLLHEETTRRQRGGSSEPLSKFMINSAMDFWSESINVRCK
jgi:hypothetical protein